MNETINTLGYLYVVFLVRIQQTDGTIRVHMGGKIFLWDPHISFENALPTNPCLVLSNIASQHF